MVSQAGIFSLTYAAEGIAWTFTALATVFFILRSISRFVILKHPIDWSDAIVIASWILAICRAIFFQIALVAVRHIQPGNDAGTVPSAAFWMYFTEHWTFLSVSLPKCAIAMLIIQLFYPRRWVKHVLIGLCVVLLSIAIAGFVASSVTCRPITSLWNPYKHPNGHCWSQVATNAIAGTFSIASAFVDLVFAIYPGFVIWNLQMSTFRRLSTMALMGVGLASCTFATVKLVCILDLKGGYPTLEARVYNGMLVNFWCSVENDCILFAACVPLTRPFFREAYHYLKTQIESQNIRKRLRHSSCRLRNFSSNSDNGK